MRFLEFKADKQLLQKSEGCDFSNLAPGSSGLLAAKFEFSPEEWDDCIKVASFSHNGCEHATLLEDDWCIIPAEALTGDKFQVSVMGGRTDGYRITTNKVTVRQGVW